MQRYRKSVSSFIWLHPAGCLLAGMLMGLPVLAQTPSEIGDVNSAVKPQAPTQPSAARIQKPPTYEPSTVGETASETHNVNNLQTVPNGGAGLTVAPPDNTMDTDGDGYKDYAEDWAQTDPKNGYSHPTDLTAEQANIDPGALEYYKAGYGRAGTVPTRMPPPRNTATPDAVSAALAPVVVATAPPPPPGAPGPNPAVAWGVGGAVVGVAVIAAAASQAGKSDDKSTKKSGPTYHCGEGSSYCPTVEKCCRSTWISNPRGGGPGVWGAYYISGACYDLENAVRKVQRDGGTVYPCVDERRLNTR